MNGSFSHTARGAFTLIEMAVVVVIVALVVGGVITTQDLIHTAKLQAVAKEFRQYQTATQTFHNKYLALPGDMRDATEYWGTDPDGCPNDTTSVFNEETCDGNGDNTLNNAGMTASGFHYKAEAFRFWQHLANAGLIEGKFTGTSTTGGVYGGAVGDVNVPSSESGGVWWASGWYHHSYFLPETHGKYGNFLMLGKERTASWPYDGIFTPEDAWRIDLKMDDGNPIRGTVWASWISRCIPTETTEEYDVLDTRVVCALVFRQVF